MFWYKQAFQRGIDCDVKTKATSEQLIQLTERRRALLRNYEFLRWTGNSPHFTEQ